PPRIGSRARPPLEVASSAIIAMVNGWLMTSRLWSPRFQNDCGPTASSSLRMVDKSAAEGEFCFGSVEVRSSALGIDACGMAADRFDACPLDVQMRCPRLIHVFSARYLSLQKGRNLQKISARFNFSSIESRSKGAHMSRHGQSRCCRFYLPWVPGTL